MKKVYLYTFWCILSKKVCAGGDENEVQTGQAQYHDERGSLEDAEGIG
jgi:hypothetical protein